jgi:hypothetical protein
VRRQLASIISIGDFLVDMDSGFPTGFLTFKVYLRIVNTSFGNMFILSIDETKSTINSKEPFKGTRQS